MTRLRSTFMAYGAKQKRILLLLALIFTLSALRGYSQTEPGPFITLDRLAFMGFATPEATIQSVKWMSLNTNFQAMMDTCLPEVRTNNDMTPEYFEASKPYLRKLFGGFQIMAKKRVEPNLVQLKVLTVTSDDPTPTSHPQTNYYITTLVQVGADWKFAKETRKYTPAWDAPPEAQNPVPVAPKSE